MKMLNQTQQQDPIVPIKQYVLRCFNHIYKSQECVGRMDIHTNQNSNKLQT